MVAGVTLLRDRTASRLTPLTATCAAIAVAGIILWQITKNPVLAIIFCIIADAFATVPTLAKTYRDRSSEYATPYYLSVISMLITLYAVETWSFTTYGFPLYMLIINVILFSFAALPLSAEFRLPEPTSYIPADSRQEIQVSMEGQVAPDAAAGGEVRRWLTYRPPARPAGMRCTRTARSCRAPVPI